ncbi:FUSC family protein [Micromonospora sp. WMMD1076]|uniref:FUSC family protein n=1 Tax=Micromonospora sp. WMMD1076 TaxID=3016103 RepID=UPI00249C7791|nr:FUSC family protein [Micromonospora sp. WMMD1076]WFF05199.1 FUSC family protein [Micromonospora sp. WMMD1076]
MTAVVPVARRHAREAYERLRRYFIVALQAGLAAGLAWYVASTLLKNPQPLFAPAAAVGTIAAAIGNRIRRTAELLGGVILGVLVGDLIINLIGAGPVQTGLVVALAISLAVVIRGNGAVMVQAGSTAVLLGTVEPNAPDLAVPRTANALVGGAVAVVVALLLLPLNPVRVVHRAAGPTLDLFADQLTVTATALAAGDAEAADAALLRLEAAEVERQQTTEVVAAAREVTSLSPWRWRRRAQLRRYEHAAAHLELAYTNSRNMARRVVALLEVGEPVPPALPIAVETFGQSLRLLHRDFLAGRTPDIARARARDAAEQVGWARAAGLGFSGTIVASQLLIVVGELLQASGMAKAEADRITGVHEHRPDSRPHPNDR